MKLHVIQPAAGRYLGSVLCDIRRSLDDGIQELLKGYGMPARSRWNNV